MSQVESTEQAERDAWLVRFGLVRDFEWNPPAGPQYTLALADNVRLFARGEDRLVVLVREQLFVDWALLEYAGHPSAQPDAVRYMLVMHGDGPSASLREPRHTYFGGDADAAGYVFYVQPKVIDWAFDCLREWFDFGGDTP